MPRKKKQNGTHETLGLTCCSNPAFARAKHLHHASGGNVFRCRSRTGKHKTRYFVLPPGAAVAISVERCQLKGVKPPPRTQWGRAPGLPAGARPLLDCEIKAAKEAERAAADKDPEAITSHRAATVAKEERWVAHPALDAVLQLLCDATTSDAVPAWFPGRPARKSVTFGCEFYRKLLDEGRGYKYDNVRRWTKSRRGIDLFDHDVFFVPINHGNVHWALGVIDVRRARIEYIDSMRTFLPARKKMALLKNLQRYLGDEWHDKHEGRVPKFALHVRDDAPQQDNGNDCGAFALAFALAVACGRPLASIKQRDIAYYRQRLGAAAQLFVSPPSDTKDEDAEGEVEIVDVKPLSRPKRTRHHL